MTAKKQPVKNMTGSTLSYKGDRYDPGVEVPGDIAEEMGLAKMPEQIQGQQGGKQQPPVFTDERDPMAIAAAQSVTPFSVPMSAQIPTTQQSDEKTPASDIIDYPDDLPDNLDPSSSETEGSEEGEQQQPKRTKRGGA
jgi:hypothetical protein